jgi:hypothetical protein
MPSSLPILYFVVILLGIAHCSGAYSFNTEVSRTKVRTNSYAVLFTNQRNHRLEFKYSSDYNGRKRSSKELTSLTSSSLLMGKNKFSLQSTDDTYDTLWERPLLLACDVLGLLIFASIGKASHTSSGDLDISAILLTALPFVIAWVGTAPLLGLYNGDATSMEEGEGIRSPPVVRLSKGWIVAVPLGITLRGIVKGYTPPLPFVIVTMISTWAILATVRYAYSKAEQKLMGN